MQGTEEWPCRGDRDACARWLVKEWRQGRRSQWWMKGAEECREAPCCYIGGGCSGYGDPSQKHQEGQTRQKHNCQ